MDLTAYQRYNGGRLFATDVSAKFKVTWHRNIKNQANQI